jgi:hypothetical protein
VATTNPNASGFYTLDLPAGNYDVTASLSGYVTQMLIGVPVVVSQTTQNVNFTLVPEAGSGHIQGHVTITGEPANVTLADVSAGGYATHPDAAGNYDLVIPAGTYSVTASHPYTDTQAVGNVVVVSGQTTPGINFTLTVNRADMICKAFVFPGVILNNVDVVIQGPEGPYTGTILNDSLVFLHVPYGTYAGTATFNNGVPISSDTLINAGNHRLYFMFDMDGIAAPEQSILLHVVPNPAGSDSRVCFTLPVSGEWSVELTDARGTVISGFKQHMNAGVQRISLSEVSRNCRMADGIYTIRLSGSNGMTGICKMLYVAHE